MPNLVGSSGFIVHRRTTSDYLLGTKDRVKRGYSLIEFLVVLGLLVIAVGVALAFLVNILQGSNQANVTAEVKQNGQALLDALEGQIRNATDVECKNSTGGKIDCSDSSAIKTYIKLIRSNSDPLHIKYFPSDASTNGRIGSFVSTADPLDSNYAFLTNQDLISGVDIQNFNFNVLPSTSGTSSPSIVSVSFSVNQGISAPSRQDFLANVQFQTTISLRKY